MRKPRYALEETLYFCKEGEFFSLVVDTITIAERGISPFLHPDFHNEIFYLDKNGLLAPESKCFNDKKEAALAEINRLQREIDEDS